MTRENAQLFRQLGSLYSHIGQQRLAINALVWLKRICIIIDVMSSPALGIIATSIVPVESTALRITLNEFSSTRREPTSSGASSKQGCIFSLF